ncbi:MAG: aspartate carbamoyltransferase catalytic subunit [Victivallales bacterium]|nr:aspartate carbamoyltransferase catalytic subunit [Victivallales bacterium]
MIEKLWTKKDLISLSELTADELTLILDTAAEFKKVNRRRVKKVPALRGKTVVNFFVEPSTRTRVSFELAEQRLSADIINMTSSTSSLIKGETLLDTLKNIESLQVDIIVMRHAASGAHKLLSERLSCGIVNAGDGAHGHPTQALLDIFTMREKKGSLEGLNVAIVGDILHSRVARSDIIGLLKMGAKVTICGPATLLPREFRKLGVRVCDNLRNAIENADVINMLRIQRERQQASYFPSISEYASIYGINSETIKYVKPDALIMHPGPINRGVEVESHIADGPQSVILEQVTNGLAVRMGVLYLIAGCLGN